MKRILLFWKGDQIIRETILHKKFIRMQTYTVSSSLAVTSVEVKIKAAKGVTDSNWIVIRIFVFCVVLLQIRIVFSTNALTIDRCNLEFEGFITWLWNLCTNIGNKWLRLCLEVNIENANLLLFLFPQIDQLYSLCY